jgi:DNA-binding CsgD family transcriptional regulator
MHYYDKIKIAVVETSDILRGGILAVLNNALNCTTEYLEVPSSQDFGKLADFGADIVIVNPAIIGNYNLKHVKSKLGEKSHYVALLNTPVDSETLNSYSGVINLYDTPGDIHAMIDRLMGYEDNSESDGLSEREKDIIKGVVRGLSNKCIADELHLSVHTIITHRRNISKKLQIHSASELTIYAIYKKIVNISDIRQNA